MSGLARSVIPLLSAWEKYTNENPDGDLPGFAKWVLAAHSPATGSPAPQPEPATNKVPDNTAPTSQAPAGMPVANQADPGQAPGLIARNHDILRLLSKPVIKDLGLTKDVEFSAIALVAIMDHPNKKALCRELLIENSTGVEITRRLAQKGLIAEKPNPEDRRSALLSVTDKGRKTLEKGYHRLSPIHNSFLDALDDIEKRTLTTLLNRINRFHSHRINHQPEIWE